MVRQPAERADWPLSDCSRDLHALSVEEAYRHLQSEHEARATAAFDVLLSARERAAPPPDGDVSDADGADDRRLVAPGPEE